MCLQNISLHCKIQIKPILLIQFSQLSFCLAREPQAPKEGGVILWFPMLKRTTDIFEERKNEKKKKNKSELALGKKKNLPADLHSKKINK